MVLRPTAGENDDGFGPRSLFSAHGTESRDGATAVSRQSVAGTDRSSWRFQDGRLDGRRPGFSKWWLAAAGSSLSARTPTFQPSTPPGSSDLRVFSRCVASPRGCFRASRARRRARAGGDAEAAFLFRPDPPVREVHTSSHRASRWDGGSARRRFTRRVVAWAPGSRRRTRPDGIRRVRDRPRRSRGPPARFAGAA